MNGENSIPVYSVLRYLFSYSDSSQGCAKLSKEIERELLHGKINTESTFSSYNLYKLIAKTKFHDVGHLFSRCEFKENDILTLVKDHKETFTENEWHKICWFEHHFSKSVELKFHDLDYADLIRLKYDKFQSFLSFKTCSKNWFKAVSEHIKEKSVRIEAAAEKNQIELVARKRHRPIIIDNEIEAILKEQFEDKVIKAISFDRTNSVCNNSLQACIEIHQDVTIDDLPVDDLCRRVFHYILRRHEMLLDHIYFVHSDALVNFKTDGYYSRFAFRDNIELKTFQSLAFQWDGTELCHENIIDGDDDEVSCLACYTSACSRVLSIKTFNIIQEWYLDIPAETQILLEQFVSTRSIIRGKNPEQLLSHKLERLYQLFDVLLNTLNRRFSGIFQQSNTDGLLIEFKNIGSVFRITSAAGITLSLDAAEKKLRAKADDDLLYYNAFIKSHTITYDTAAGEITTSVSMRQCLPIVMLDNLVRFTDKKNANPGVKGNQLCTLPITIQGLPKDSSIIEQWHDVDCSKMPNCQCLQPQPLTRSDMNRVLLELSHKETEMKRQFGKLMTWGYTQLWRNMTGKLNRK